jgi:hypothetical protein
MVAASDHSLEMLIPAGNRQSSADAVHPDSPAKAGFFGVFRLS